MPPMFPARPVNVVLVVAPESLPVTASKAVYPANPPPEMPVAVPLNDGVVVELLVGLLNVLEFSATADAPVNPE